MVRHFTGQTSTQALQEQQRSRSMVHSRAGLLTTMASVGHRFWQSMQNVQVSMSMAMLPLDLSAWCGTFSLVGYSRVAGRERRFLRVVRVILKTGTRYLSEQLMHGSMVRMRTGTSARSQPCSIFTSAGMLAKVGVRTR